MKIKKLGDDLFKAYREAWLSVKDSRKEVKENIWRLEPDLLFMWVSQQEVIDFYERWRVYETEDQAINIKELLQQHLDKKMRLRNYNVFTNAEWKDEYDYANLAPSRRKDYYYDCDQEYCGAIHQAIQ